MKGSLFVALTSLVCALFVGAESDSYWPLIICANIWSAAVVVIANTKLRPTPTKMMGEGQ